MTGVNVDCHVITFCNNLKLTVQCETTSKFVEIGKAVSPRFLEIVLFHTISTSYENLFFRSFKGFPYSAHCKRSSKQRIGKHKQTPPSPGQVFPAELDTADLHSLTLMKESGSGILPLGAAKGVGPSLFLVNYLIVYFPIVYGFYFPTS